MPEYERNNRAMLLYLENLDIERAYRVLVIPLVLTAIRIALGYYTAVLMFTANSWSQYREELTANVILPVSLSCAAVNDAVIVASQFYYLRRRRTGACGTEYIIRTVMIYSVNMGAITMAASVAALLAFILDKSSLLDGRFVELQCRLFALSLLANLNTRRTMRDNQPRDAVEFCPHNFTGDAAQGSSRLSPGGHQRQLIPKLLHNPSQ
ncbi:uncharacterized protein B0H18DRAFT_1211899 [Fomitopsis serialis]|uniref:uncharacterized protein n=1 Tax=Fomitopsis serialis TaxID=139415 RepID=UPI002008BE2E|nr:uncharacterized protein B0H18DRAFT_1211899 [Neoantrodia serialis]KAH9924472.1 hypothetical protein B0H18DRAFT_1211899 [Neoantrodia serialis]